MLVGKKLLARENKSFMGIHICLMHPTTTMGRKEPIQEPGRINEPNAQLNYFVSAIRKASRS